MMMASHPLIDLGYPNQAELDWLSAAGIDAMTLAHPAAPMHIAVGLVAADGRFESDPAGLRWLAFEELTADDIVFWQPRLCGLGNWTGRAFALGEAIIDDATTYSIGGSLNIFADPIDWLRAGRDGIVVLPGKWPLAFDRLRDIPRIALAEQLLPLYRRHMKPARLPELRVMTEARCAA